MGERRKPPEIPFELKDGKKLFTLNTRQDCQMRPAPPVTGVTANQGQPGRTDDQASGDGDGSSNQGAGAGGDSGVVRMRCRLASSVYVRCWLGGVSEWFGGQVVANFHNDSAALREALDMINEAARAVPLMWNHTDDIKDKAGHIENAAWEEASDIPCGVNVDLVVNEEYDPKAAKGLRLGVLNATSIGWTPRYELSHPEMSFEEFAMRQGETVNGRVVCWLPVKCLSVSHHALVCAGADPDSGPRAENNNQGTSADQPARNSQTGGKRGMNEEQLLAMLSTICKAHGVDVALAPGGEIPEGLGDRIAGLATGLRKVGGDYNALAQGLQSLGASLLKEGEATLSAVEVLNRLPERLAMAKHGEAFLKSQQATCLKWFDTVRVDPNNPDNMSDADKRERTRLAACEDLQHLEDRITEYHKEAVKRFGSKVDMRSSVGEDPNAGTRGPTTVNTAKLVEEARLNHYMARRQPKEGGKD